MKIAPRKTKTRLQSRRITSPEFRVNQETGKKELLLSFADERSNHQHKVTNKDLFLYAAGTNEEGELPDGLDRLTDHRFVVHVDENDKAIGLDIIPARLYRSKVIPVSQVDIKTVKIQWELNGAVCRVIQRPAGVRPDVLASVILELDKLATAGKEIQPRTKLGNIARISAIESEDTIEIKMNATRGQGNPVYALPEEDE